MIIGDMQQAFHMETISPFMHADHWRIHWHNAVIPAVYDQFEMSQKYVSLQLGFAAAEKYLNAKGLFTRSCCFHLPEHLKSCFFQPLSRSKH